MSDKLDLILEKLGEIEQNNNERLDKIDQRLDKIETNLDATMKMVAATAEDVSSLKAKIHDIETTTAFVTKDVYMLKNRAK